MCRETSPHGLMVSLVSVKFGVIHTRLNKVSDVKRKTYWTPKEHYISHLLVLLHLYPDSFPSVWHLGASCLLQAKADSVGGLVKLLLMRQVC